LVLITNSVVQVVGRRNKCFGDSNAKPETDATGSEKYETREGESVAWYSHKMMAIKC
jgi:hypothetical protein